MNVKAHISPQIIAAIALFVALALCPLLASSAPATHEATYNYYVASTGSDANPGTAQLPFQTIMRAARIALPGTTVHVAPGVYTGGFKTSISGIETQRIYYVSSVHRRARLVPPMSSETKSAWDNRGSYVDIIGFDVDGRAARNGVKWTHGIYSGGSHTAIKDNYIHHIAQNIPCGNSSGAGIGVDSYYRGIRSDVIGNTVHDIGPAGCRFVSGIHISTSGSAVNNVVYNIGGAGILMWHDAHDVKVTNNTITGSTTGVLVGGGDYYHTRGPNNNTRVHNNIIYDNKYGVWEQGETGINNTYRNNLVFHNAVADWQLRNGLAHTGTVAQEPQFVRYARKGQSDFRLRGNSPAIGAGTAEHASAADVAGKLRSKGTEIDLGAYQFK